MAEALLVKTEDGSFASLGDGLEGVRAGQVIRVKFTLARNPLFHRKMFALFNFIFDALPEPQPVRINGVEVVPLRDFNTARKEFVVMAGFYDVVAKVDGTVKMVAKSLSFGSMDQGEFEKVYSAVIDVGLQILPYEMNEKTLDIAVENLMGFA